MNEFSTYVIAQLSVLVHFKQFSYVVLQSAPEGGDILVRLIMNPPRGRWIIAPFQMQADRSGETTHALAPAQGVDPHASTGMPLNAASQKGKS
jgi:hypothetical protein